MHDHAEYGEISEPWKTVAMPQSVTIAGNIIFGPRRYMPFSQMLAPHQVGDIQQI